jgi:hypothetical protein
MAEMATFGRFLDAMISHYLVMTYAPAAGDGLSMSKP